MHVHAFATWLNGQANNYQHATTSQLKTKVFWNQSSFHRATFISVSYKSGNQEHALQASLRLYIRFRMWITHLHCKVVLPAVGASNWLS